MVHGFFRVLGAESLVLPAGIVVVGVLARKLDTAGFARFSLAFAIVSLAELFVVSLLAGSANKAVSTSSDWRPVGDAVLGIYLAVAGATGLILIALAHGIALSLHLPALEPDLRLFALDLLPFGLARAHRDILSGTGRFAQRAISAAVGTLVRMALTVAFVLASPTVSSAIVGTIGGSVAERCIAAGVRGRLSAWKGVFSFTRQGYLGPVFVASVAELVLARIDLVVLRWLGAPSDQVGLYGAAQRLSLVVGLYGAAIAGPLLATLGILMRDGKRPAAANLARLGVRVGLLVLPFVALITATATELATLVLGVQYAAAGPLLAILITAAFARIMVVVGNVLLLGADRPRLAARLAIIAVGGAFVAYWILIPHGVAGPLP
jgi:O-antigen/teichoic acid export membrane protein